MHSAWFERRDVRLRRIICIRSRFQSAMEFCPVSLASDFSKKTATNVNDVLQEDSDGEIELTFWEMNTIDDFDDTSYNEMVEAVEPLLNDLTLASSPLGGQPDESISEQTELLHGHTSMTTANFCHRFLNLIRQTNVCKGKAKEYLDLIGSVLPHPNNCPSSIEKVFAMLDIKRNLFHKRIVCVLCHRDVPSTANACSSCVSVADETHLAFVYDSDLVYVVNILLKRLHRSIADYSKEIKLGVESSTKRDIPFGSVYQKLLHRCPNSNLISALLHLDGISLAKSSKLKLWLFSFAIVELPPKLRFARHNIPVVSIWVGHRDPIPQLWLRKPMLSLNTLRSNGIY